MFLYFLRVCERVCTLCHTRDLGEVSVEGELRAVLQGLHQITGNFVDVLLGTGQEHEGEGDHDAAWSQMSD